MASDFLEAAPFGDEERHRLGAFAYRFELDALVEPMDRIGVRSVDEGGDAGIEAEEARVGGAGGGDLDERLAEDVPVGAAEQGDGVLAVLQYIAFRLEAVIDDLGRVVG